MFFKRKYKVAGFCIAALILLTYQSAFSTVKAQYSRTKQGIVLKIDGAYVELAAEGDSAFRLSLNRKNNSGAISSIFVRENKSTNTNVSIISEEPVFGLKTSYGKFIINTDTKHWSLFDSNGKALISNGTFNSTDTEQVIIHASATGRLYGAGNNSTKSLIKYESNSSMGNGTADIPYLWDLGGYSALGITADDNSPAKWECNNSMVTWQFHGTKADLYLWPAKNLYDASKGLAKITGSPKLPPRWAFGYLQSQWGWVDRAYIEDVLMNFRTRDLPVDAFIYDFEWYTEKPDYEIGKNGEPDFTDFTFNPKLFPEPEKQIADYKKQGVKFIGIRKPRLGNSELISYARKKNWLIRPESESRDLDFRNKDLRKWYIRQSKDLLNSGIDAWWDDEGESYYSCYYWWNTAQIELQDQVKPNSRYFSINRSFSPGIQRLGICTWNGDVESTWEALNQTTADLLNYSLSGMCYGSCDIGGFQGTPSKENLVRWFQAGVFFPIMRAHSNIMTKPRFPWLWDEDGEAAIRKALDLRYQLLPYIYSLGHEAFSTGAPIMRPLLMEFQDDKKVADMTDEWLLGRGLLAAPVLNKGGERKIYLPEDTWYDFYSGKTIEGPAQIEVSAELDEIPVFVRSGTILPLGPVVQYSGQRVDEPLEIRIYPGKNGSFTMTEDDGTSFNYIKGNIRTTTFFWDDKEETLRWEVDGSYDDDNLYKTIKVVLGDQVKKFQIGEKGRASFE